MPLRYFDVFGLIDFNCMYNNSNQKKKKKKQYVLYRC